MALFPAFADADNAGDVQASEGSKRDLNWLTNQSFCNEDALRLHQNVLEITDCVPLLQSNTATSFELPEENEANKSFQDSPKKRKKKKKQRDHKKNKKKRRKEWTTSGSEPEDVRDDKNNEKGGTELNLEEKNTNVLYPSTWLDDVQGLTAEGFRTDKKPDPANWQYKSLYRGNIARYKRRSNFCLGLQSKEQHIIWESSAAEKTSSYKRLERYFTKAGRKLLNEEGIHVSSKNQDSSSGSASWIPILQLDPAEAPSTSWVEGVYDLQTTLWLQGKGPPAEHGLSNKQDPQENPKNVDSPLMAKVEEYNCRVRENPRDVKAWMDLVSFQDELMRHPSCYAISEGEREMRKKSSKLILEKKLAILERAIENNPNEVDLKLARLKLCIEFWEPSAVVKEWQKLIFLHPNNPALWQKYLLFCQSQFSTFTVSKTHGCYGKCLSTLSAVYDGSMLSHPELPGTEEAMLAIFLQQCHFLRQAGHSEKAVSLFQALLDFTFFKPDNVKDLPTRGQREFFEPFWDSGEPRIGEKGAKGWKAWMHQQEKGGWVVINPPDEDEEDVEDEEEIKDRSLPKWQNWLHIERSREARHWMPWRPEKNKKQSSEDCEDPERQVLFDDLGPSLIRLSSPELQFQLLSSFLQFLGVPCSCRLSLSSFYIAMDENNVFDNGYNNQGILTSLDMPLFGVSNIGHMDSLVQGEKHVTHSKEGEQFIQNLFHMMLPLFSGKDRSNLCIFWLQYEIAKVNQYLKMGKKKKLKLQGKKSKKLAKNLLKAPDNRNNVSLWQLYAYLEWLLGNIEDARKVFDTSLGMAGISGIQNPQFCHLSLLYAKLEAELLVNLEGAVESRATHILTKLAERGHYVPYHGQVSSVNVLKARKTYEHLLQDCLTENLTSDQEHASDSSHLTGLVGCYALFQYLTLGIDSAMSVYCQVSQKLKDEDPGDRLSGQHFTMPLEALSLMHVNLLRFHMKISVYPLSPLREVLLEVLKRHPSNQSFWKAYIQIQSKSHNASKARRFFDAVTRTTQSLEPWLFAIQMEQMRKNLIESVQREPTGDVYAMIPEIGLTNRIKVLFEHAIQTENGAHCPLLWRLYICFMVSLGDKAKSKGVFYRALQNCPWAKVLYMDAIEYFPDELQEFLDLMAEKELRVRVPIEELELLLED
ncbi:nuclear exosome regulator NRDE2 [Crotalus tigris]|uniref:nuclear exosome regulator NRDE2 n=1 Tax=Crotalus tigris TaxID=88082 RepID=UPI00192F4385|nr:nuclear exosome regulator NRDE2 [Crotalus tigris]